MEQWLYHRFNSARLSSSSLNKKSEYTSFYFNRTSILRNIGEMEFEVVFHSRFSRFSSLKLHNESRTTCQDLSRDESKQCLARRLTWKSFALVFLCVPFLGGGWNKMRWYAVYNKTESDECGSCYCCPRVRQYWSHESHHFEQGLLSFRLPRNKVSHISFDITL